MRLIDADKFKQEIAAATIKYNLVAPKGNAMCELIDRQPTAYDVDNVVERLAEYEDLEKQRRLLKLPCSVGDVVYEIGLPEDPIEKKKIDSIEICDSGVCIYAREISGSFETYDISDFGEIVFLTRREAEAALKVN